ncbi:FYVE, RhoGEF and PH domain-containing protein 5 isoform X1 [Astyanax mexicanus]|uniref:FYVE, RhoGEF and PH domain-containing protein 5 isoform X1 n=1 Tax=Astyanax mexicanus TaxID=7994 RepID=UPI0020CACCFB|nr:FYVE, RhoGEF and PH domain-containing protein 5 isoform X1 [Astyanax mexicanus]
MSAKLEDRRSRSHVCRSNEQLGPLAGKCCHHQGCKPDTAPKPRSNSRQFPHLNNYLKKYTNRNLTPANVEAHNLKIHRKQVFGHLRHENDLKQREASKPCKDIGHKERSMQWEEFTEVDKKEHSDQGEELGYGEELAQGIELDWEVGLHHGEGFDSEEGEGPRELLSDSCSDRDEEVQGVARQLHKVAEREEGWEVVGNGETGSPRSLVDVHFGIQSTPYTLYKTMMHETNRNKIQASSLKLRDNLYTDEIFSAKMLSNGLYSNHLYSNGINTNELYPDGTDTVAMFPDMCDAGEALADADGLSECDLFEQTEASQTLEAEEVGDPGDTVMLSVEEGSENSSASISNFGEEGGEEENSSLSLRNSSQDLHCETSQDSSLSDSTLYAKSEREAGILSESSHQPSSSFSSFCSSQSEITSDEAESSETLHFHWSEIERATPSNEPHFNTTFDLDLPCFSSPIQPEDQKSHQTQFDEHGKEISNAQGDQLIIPTENPKVQSEEHVYEETEPKFQPKSFLQTRKYLMTRSISMEPPSNRLEPMNSTVSGKERLMLHTQSYYTSHDFLGESLPALTGSLGCLSPGCPCPPSDLGMNSHDIPPPFELSSITKRPIRKSTPALPTDVSASCRKLDFGFKRYFLPLRFLRKSERRSLADNRSVSSRSSSESSPQGSCKRLNLIRQNVGSPELHRVHDSSLPSSPSSFLYQKNKQRQGLNTLLNSNVLSGIPSSWDTDDFLHSSFTKPFPLSKPRSFSSPNVDSSVYENVLSPSPHYENLQLRLLNPTSQRHRNQSSANDIDGYVDMSSLPGFQSKSQSSEQETESAYTICSPAVRSDGSVSVSVGVPCIKKEEKKGSEILTVTCSRAFYSAKELLDSEAQHLKNLKLLTETVGGDETLGELWSDLPAIYTLHQDLHTQLESRIKEWEQKEGIADIILDKKAEFSFFSSFITHHDSRMKSLEQMENTQLDMTSLKQQLLQVIVRVLQYRMLLTDYMNNISPNTSEYKDTQDALTVVSDVADLTNESLSNGVALLRLVHIEHNVLGLKNLLQPNRVFVKEGTLMKVSRKSKQPRHLFLMSDIMLYTYPQQDGKYRLINTLTLTGMEVTKLMIDNTQHALKIELKDTCITLSTSSSIERDDWFVTLNRTIADLGSVLGEPTGCLEFGETVEACLGENAPPLVSVSQVSVCMNCPVRFSLTHRRHHCRACGKVVCRDCCRNKVPLKYLKNRRAKVCDKCYSELYKPDEDVAMGTGSSSRPLSAVFQNIHPTSLWRGRKGQLTFNQGIGPEGEMSGTLERSRNSRRSWKSLWFLLKDKVLYTYPQPEERIACESLPLLGFSVRPEIEGESSVFQLYHKTTLYYTFKAQDTHTAQRWVSAMEEATVL